MNVKGEIVKMNSFFPPIIQACIFCYYIWLQLVVLGFSSLIVGALTIWWLGDMLKIIMSNKPLFVVSKSGSLISEFIEWIQNGLNSKFKMKAKRISYSQTYVFVKLMISLALLIIFI